MEEVKDGGEVKERQVVVSLSLSLSCVPERVSVEGRKGGPGVQGIHGGLELCRALFIALLCLHFESCSGGNGGERTEFFCAKNR